MATTFTVSPWIADTALAGFEARALLFPPDAEGPVIATLVRRRAAASAGRAVLYLHGFVDYFFQTHLAEAFNAHGYHFYALDLRKCGRSLRPGQTPNFCVDLREYYAELDAAITLICNEEDHPWLLLNGHSTGGLIAALYAHEGRWRERVKALFLNSPFFAFHLPWRQVAPARLFACLGRWRPRLAASGSVSPFYAHSLHRAYYGEWEFSLDWKPIEGFPAYAGWMHAVMQGQHRLQTGLAIACPVLIMHSARSVLLPRWDERLLRADAVLNVAHMRRYGPGLGPHVTLIAIEGGLHDLTLSAAPVRARVFEELFAWLECQGRAR
ncbi:MAG: alpha/beta hydrolase [Chloroflexaceae bacterium]